MAGVINQPGASLGDQTYCPVSGVVFEAKAESGHRRWKDRELHFCCEACAKYFDEHTARVVAARGY